MTGRLIIMGSGELAPTLVRVHRAGIEAAGASSVSILDTPFGFQTNVRHLTEKLTDFFHTSLVIETEIISLRRADVPIVDRERAVAAARRARYLFAGPGSPSYALSVWQEAAGMPDAIAGVIAAGGTVAFASAAALTAGVKTIPVYEIYKVGADPYWLDGLDLTGAFGLPMVIVPHWNNAEGGNHDTSRCYIGEHRLRQLATGLDVGILGVDEHTAAIVDFGAATLSVTGRGSVTLRRGSDIVLGDGATMPLAEVAHHLGSDLGAVTATEPLPTVPPRNSDAWVAAILEAEDLAADDPGARSKLRSMIVELGEAARTGLRDPREVVGGFVDLLIELRRTARNEGRYEVSDLIRIRLDELGLEVRDAPDGTSWDFTT